MKKIEKLTNPRSYECSWGYYDPQAGGVNLVFCTKEVQEAIDKYMVDKLYGFELIIHEIYHGKQVKTYSVDIDYMEEVLDIINNFNVFKDKIKKSFVKAIKINSLICELEACRNRIINETVSDMLYEIKFKRMLNEVSDFVNK